MKCDGMEQEHIAMVEFGFCATIDNSAKPRLVVLLA
jgi:hypothetical protein